VKKFESLNAEQQRIHDTLDFCCPECSTQVKFKDAYKHAFELCPKLYLTCPTQCGTTETFATDQALRSHLAHKCRHVSHICVCRQAAETLYIIQDDFRPC
jgi:hypothetical protein